MHYLVTGGTGFVGKALCQQLYQAGHTVTVLIRSRTHAASVLGNSVLLAEHLSEVTAVDAIINLAGQNLAEQRWTAARKQAFWESRVTFTDRLVAWIAALPAEQRPKVLVSASAIGWYGVSDQPLDESSPRQATPTAALQFAADLCAAWEASAQKAKSLGVRVCLARIGVVVGPGGAIAKLRLPFKLGLGGRLAEGKQFLSWIRRVDLVRLLLWLAETPTCQGVYNATAPLPITNLEFTHALGKVWQRPTLLPMPAFMLKATLGEFADLLLTGQPVFPRKAEREGFVFKVRNMAHALDGL
jgi:hypothetical protein